MDKDARERLAGKLLGLAKRSLPVGPQQLRVEFGDFGFDDEGLAQLDEVRNWLLRENGWGEKYSEKHLTEVLAGVVAPLRATLDYQDALKAASKLDQDWLALIDVQLVYLPIENVQMTLFELKIGRVCITRVAPKMRRGFEAGVRKALASSKKTPEEVELFVAQQMERFDRLGEVISIVEVNAEPVRAHEIALEETRRALDYLNYAATAISNVALRRAVGISGDAFRGVRSHLVVKSDFTHYSSSHDFREGIAAVTLNGAFKKELPRLGYAKVSKMLFSPKPTDLEEAVIQALHWYSDSWVQSSLENELLGLVTALETFFTRGRGITFQLSEGVAFILTQGLEHRKRVVERIKYLYGLRGKVTHGREQQILPAEVAELRFYVLNVINVMIRNPQKWDSRQRCTSGLRISASRSDRSAVRHGYERTTSGQPWGRSPSATIRAMNEARDWILHPRQRWEQRRRHASHLKEFAEYARERDPVENAESTPPADEEIRLHAVWMAESYPLSFFDSLLDAVRRLTADSRHYSGDPPAERLEEALRLGNSGWLPLGPVVPPGSPLYAYLPSIKAVLPTDVEYAHASVHYLVPSHAVLVACFVLEEAGSRQVEESLRATYESYTTQRGSWTAIHGPANQKREAVLATRAQHIAELTTFFDREAPGLFVSDARPLPSIEFWTTKERKPFEEREARSRGSLHDFIELLGWVVWTNVWQGPDSLALKEAPLTGDDFWSRAPNLQLVARERELFAGEKLEAYGGQSREAYINRLKDSIDPLAAALALTETFRFYEAELVASRRRLREAQRRSLRRRVKATVAVQDRLLRQHADVDAAARGVTRWRDDLLRLLRRHTFDFERWLPPSVRYADDEEQADGETSRPRRWLARLTKRAEEPEQREPKRRSWPPETWLDTQTREIIERAEHVVAGSREISDVVRTISEMTSAQASLRVQRQVAILTWVLVAIGIAAPIIVVVLTGS